MNRELANECVDACQVRFEFISQSFFYFQIKLVWDFVLLAQLAEVNQLLLQLRFTVIVVRQDRRKSAGDEREGENTDALEDDAPNHLWCVLSQQVSIADSGNRRCREVKRFDVSSLVKNKPAVLDIVVAVFNQPSRCVFNRWKPILSSLFDELADNDDAAGANVQEENHEKAKKDEAFWTMVDLKLVRKLENDSVLWLQQLEKLCEPGHSDELIKSTDAGEFDDGVNLVGFGTYKSIKRHDGQQVEAEPALQVVQNNLLPVSDLVVLTLVDVRRVERQQNVDAEANVDKIVNDRPIMVFRGLVRNTVRDKNADEDQFEENKEVPDDL